jgi:ribosome-binding protein aMBF1 (putative translation factor)
MPRLWQQQANEARRAAAATSHPDLKRELLSIAEDYENRAKRARERTLARDRTRGE